MSLEKSLKKAWSSTVDLVKSKRMIQNYPNDILAGNLSRTPLYAVFDNVLVGVEDGKVMDSVLNSLEYSAYGWSLFYILGNSVTANSFGKIYNKHSKLIDAVYSSVMTFGFGMLVNLNAGYTFKQAIAASSIRSAIAFPLGPITRYYSDAFREIRNEPAIVKETNFKNKSIGYKLPRAAALVGVPLGILFGTLALTPNNEISTDQSTQPVKEIIIINEEVNITNISSNSHYQITTS